ncbi:MAG: response regulator [Rhodospirillaceae bacterium]
MKDIRQRLLAAFDIEYREHLTAIRQMLPAGTQTGSEEDAPVTTAATLAEIVRRAHSLKGAARAVDLRAVEMLAHRLESLLVLVQKGDAALDAISRPVIHQALDQIEDLVVSAANPAAPVVVPDLSALDRLLDRDAPKPGPVPPEEPPVKAPDGLKPSEPPPEPEPPARPETVRGEEMMRVDATSLDQLLQSSGRLSAEISRNSGRSSDIRRIHRELNDALHDWGRFRKVFSRQIRQLAVNPAYGRIATQLEAMETRITAVARSVDRVAKTSEQGSKTLAQLAEHLQNDVQHVRTIPAEHVFGGFRKMVRDIAREHGKQVVVQVSGLGVEVDRLILQQLKDPVMHVLRNAVSHGIETPAERIACGKPPEARIGLVLTATGGRLTILVADDGRGLDYHQIAEVAVAHGLMSTEEAAAAPPETLARLLLRPGFSTTTAVDTLSGRGVGLSVLHEAVGRLHGVIDIRPAPGTGTTPIAGTVVEIITPLTVSRQHLLLVGCGGQTWGIPGFTVECLLHIKPEQIVTVEDRPVIVLESRVVPVMTLRRAIGINEDMNPGSTLSAVVVRVAGRRLALTVDELLQVRDCLISDPVKGADRSVMGTILLDSGEIAFVLDPAVLFEIQAAGNIGGTFKSAARVATPPAARTILVVDDSVTTRTLEKSILEARGFRVRLAVDGIDALAELRQNPVDLVISDIEMPRMNGLILLEAIKQDSTLQKIPVILVTSHSNPEDVQRGLNLGADAYIVKQRFDQHELLDAIEQLL